MAGAGVAVIVGTHRCSARTVTQSTERISDIFPFANEFYFVRLTNGVKAVHEMHPTPRMTGTVGCVLRTEKRPKWLKMIHEM